MNFNVFLSKVFCSGVFSYFLGVGAGLLILYYMDKTQERKKMEDTLQEIEAMIKTLELKSKNLRIEPEH